MKRHPGTQEPRNTLTRTILLLVLVTALLSHHASGLHFVSVGDWGDERPTGIVNQKEVANAINEWCGAHDCSFILSTGDNFYPIGVTSADDSRFDTSWRWIYNLTNIDSKQWYISIGNHDHGIDGREFYQVEFGNTEPRWYYPSLWYDWHPEGDTNLHVIVIDSESLRLDKNDPAAQMSWLEETLAGSTSDWKMVVDHHPPYCVGDHGPTDSTMVNDVVPLCLQYGVQIFLSGHEHNLEHLSPMVNPTIDYVVSGGGGRGLYPLEQDNVDYLISIGIQLDNFSYEYGFVAFDFTPTTYTANFVDATGTILYSYSRSK